MEIFKLFGSILVNTDEADKSLAKTDKSAKSVASTLGSGVKTAAKWGAAIGTAAAGAAAGMYKMATSSASVADDVDKMSQKIGVSREAYQELSFALSQSGTDVSKLQAGLKTLSTQAEKGNSYFEQLGISLTDVNGNAKTQEELFFDVTNALQQMEAGTEKTAIATTLLGKSGTELMPLFNGAAGSLDEMRQQAHDLGLVLDDELIDNGVNLTDALDQMKRALGAIGTQLGGRLMPIVEKAADFVTGNLPKINKLIDQITPTVESVFDQIVPVLMDLASTLLPEIIEVVASLLPPISRIFSALAPVVSELVQKLAPVLVRIVEKLLPPLVGIIEDLMPLIEIALDILDPVLDLVLAFVDPIADILKMLSPIIKFATELLNDILKPIKPVIEAVADVLGNMLGGAISNVAGLIGDGLIPIFKGLIDFLNGDFETGISEAGEGLVNVFSGALGVIDSIFGTNLQKWYNEVTAFWRDAGAKLYEVFHADEINAREQDSLATDIQRQIVQTSNEYMREGMDAAEALAQAKNEVLNTTEKLALFNSRLADKLTEEEAKQRRAQLETTGQIRSFSAADYYSSHFSTPHLASGGVVYGKTLAVVGDNENVKSDPEVVSPLSKLGEISGSKEQAEATNRLIDLLTQLLTDPVPITLNLDGQKVATAVTNRINAMRYARGSEVIV